ncbi:hypothetical protein [Vibrio nigripulchritudo]|uniref:hypothetical protein n=1 Tax=Vibrio nigripulchritudo TaxID=28173 RepID=UPI002491075A|nr:hypothetical protein [Vibrio nigripulchritudo]BDU37153.1 hypothetical protein TUMSATVNIG2_16220 [Vibrio nigripulchritudo]BDU42865.1 hypothetical protein TUMSATVNIG3_16630 [Vibrio nigripulchritudo]
MKDVLAKIEKAQDELSQHSQSDPKSLPGFLSKFTKPLEIIRDYWYVLAMIYIDTFGFRRMLRVGFEHWLDKRFGRQ